MGLQTKGQAQAELAQATQTEANKIYKKIKAIKSIMAQISSLNDPKLYYANNVLQSRLELYYEDLTMLEMLDNAEAVWDVDR